MAKRINKVIELWEDKQPIYLTHPTDLSYDAGVKDSQTWADLLLIDFEHHPFDIVGLTNYMKGLKEKKNESSDKLKSASKHKRSKKRKLSKDGKRKI